MSHCFAFNFQPHLFEQLATFLSKRSQIQHSYFTRNDINKSLSSPVHWKFKKRLWKPPGWRGPLTWTPISWLLMAHFFPAQPLCSLTLLTPAALIARRCLRAWPPSWLGWLCFEKPSLKEFPRVSLGFSLGFLGFPLGFPWVSLGFSLDFAWFLVGYSRLGPK